MFNLLKENLHHLVLLELGVEVAVVVEEAVTVVAEEVDVVAEVEVVEMMVEVREVVVAAEVDLDEMEIGNVQILNVETITFHGELNATGVMRLDLKVLVEDPHQMVDQEVGVVEEA